MFTRNLLGPTKREHNALFTSIPVFDGDRTQCEQWLDDMDQATRISGCDLRTEFDQEINWCGKKCHHDGTSRYI